LRTPATDRLAELGIAFRLLEYDEVEKTALEVARKLDLAPGSVYKTLLAASGREFALAVVPGTGELSLKALARAWGRPSCAMADPGDITRQTGYVRGSVSPLGTKRALKVFVDASARGRQVAVSAGRRGLELVLAGDDLVRAAGAEWAELLR